MSGTRHLLLFLTLAVVWGVSFVAIKAGLSSFPPVLFAALRYDLAAVVMLGAAVLGSGRWRPRSRADWVAVGVDGVLIIAAYNALLFYGESFVTSGVAAILIATNPLFSTVLSRGLLPDERLAPAGVAGLVLGFLGVGLVARPDPSNLLASGFVGKLLVVGAALSVATGSVLVQRVDDDMSETATTAWACLLGAVLLHVTSAGLVRTGLEEPLSVDAVTADGVVALVYLAVVASAMGYFIYFTLLEALGPIEINLISYAAPVPATVVGWLLLGEVVGPVTVAGFLAVFAGFALLKRDALRRRFRALRDRGPDDAAARTR